MFLFLMFTKCSISTLIDTQIAMQAVSVYDLGFSEADVWGPFHICLFLYLHFILEGVSSCPSSCPLFFASPIQFYQMEIVAAFLHSAHVSCARVCSEV